MSDEPVAACPACGRRARRLISGGAGFLFRGEGFYITDHRSEAYRERERKEAGAAPGGKAERKTGVGDADLPKKTAESSDSSGKTREAAAAG